MGYIEGQESIEIAAPQSEVFEAITAIETHAEWQSGVKRVEVKETGPDGRPLVVESVSDAMVKDVRYELRYRYTEPTLMEWSYVDGDVRDMQGSYAVENLGEDVSRLDFELRVDPGRRLGLILRGPVVDKVRSHVMGKTLKEVKAHCEG